MAKRASDENNTDAVVREKRIDGTDDNFSEHKYMAICIDHGMKSVHSITTTVKAFSKRHDRPIIPKITAQAAATAV